MKKEEMVLMIHGFSGGTYEVKPAAPYFRRAGLKVKMLRVAGHERSREDLRNSDRFQWYESIRKQCLTFRRYPIHLLGFSMGGLLAARFVAEYQNRLAIKSLCLIGTPIQLFSFRNSMFGLTRLVRQEKNLFGARWKTFHEQSPPWESLVDFSLMLHKYKPLFSNIHTPTCIVHGEKDAVAHPSSARWIHRRLPLAGERKELHYIKDGGHQLFEPSTLVQTATICRTFMLKYS